MREVGWAAEEHYYATRWAPRTPLILPREDGTVADKTSDPMARVRGLLAESRQAITDGRDLIERGITLRADAFAALPAGARLRFDSEHLDFVIELGPGAVGALKPADRRGGRSARGVTRPGGER